MPDGISEGPEVPVVGALVTFGWWTVAHAGPSPLVADTDFPDTDTDVLDTDTDVLDTDTDVLDTDDTDLLDTGDTDLPPPTVDTDQLVDTDIPFCEDCQSASDLAGETGGPPTCQVGLALGAATQAPLFVGLVAAAVARRRSALRRRAS